MLLPLYKIIPFVPVVTMCMRTHLIYYSLSACIYERSFRNEITPVFLSARVKNQKIGQVFRPFRSAAAVILLRA